MLKKLGIITVTLFLVLAGCTQKQTSSGVLKGTVKADGSSTVFPITEAVGEEFQKVNPNVRVTVGLSGTGGGFKKFASGETDISNASRPIEADEQALAQKNGVNYVELKVAYDGLSVVVNPANKFVKDLTVAELKKIWQAGSKVKTWKDVRPNWPDAEIKLFGPGTDSGTFDYFTKAINGEEDNSRSDYTASEDDNVLVQGVAGEKYALGYFGYAYYLENKDKLKLVSVNGVYPSVKTIRDGSYKPLSRLLYIYINTKALKRPEVKAFVKFYLKNAPKLVKQVGYVPLPEKEYQKNLKLIEAGKKSG